MTVPDRNAALLAEIRPKVGIALNPTAWVNVTQQEVNDFGRLTGETLWIHTDAVRAATEGFGTTSIQASLMLARLGGWAQEAGAWIDAARVPLVYGYDRVRILQSASVGTALRCMVTIRQAEPHRLGVKMTCGMSVECSALTGPVLVADWIVVFVA